MDRVDPGRAASSRLEAHPIGIAADEFSRPAASDADACARARGARDAIRRPPLLVAVDRLDYTKGIPERLRTFRRLLRASPERRGKVVLVQVAVPSRETHPATTQSCAAR